MSPGVYKIEIMTSGRGQPTTVQEILGKNNAYLTGPNITMMVWPTYDLKTTITVPGRVDHDMDAKHMQSSRDNEVAGIRESCKKRWGSYSAEDVSACIDQAIKTIPDE
jgi:hypothetical protein